MTPETYDAWYASPRGRWIGGIEHALLGSLLRLAAGSSLLDIGCGTGYFTRRFARDVDGPVVGLDPNAAWLRYAQARAENGERYVAGRAEALPFPDRSFDASISVTALCFVRDEAQALREQLRVTRRRFALGLLNRNSLLHAQKGRAGGSGGYRGAHWHSVAEVRALFAPLPVANLEIRTAVLLPQGGTLARALEALWPQTAPCGGFLAVAGDSTAATL